MKEFIEKLIERLEEYKYTHLIEHNCEICKHFDEQGKDCVNLDCMLCVWDKAKVIVNKLAEEYSANTPQKSAGGWIPCSRELPKNGIHVLCYGKNSLGSFKYEVSVYAEEIECWMCSKIADVIAWQPLPAPYRMEKSENAEWKDAVMNHFTKIE